ncbi:hypothetical protein BDR03DRAFT_1008364 [Suillus americanus]|nr:hypothetical protein BDR03DRAFT_1008364 [Suillus americanus]
MFPQAFAYPPQPITTQTNIMYAGWNVDVPRLGFFANGLRDPWREGTDGLNKPNTTSMPIYEGDGFHCSDLITENGINIEWLAEWTPSA